MESFWMYGVSVCTTFALAFLKAFQSRNIVGGHYTAAWCSSWLVTSFEVLAISLVVAGGWTIIFSAGVGGAIGTVVAMYTHSRLFPSRLAPLKVKES
jgi:hypothetical protein